MKDWLSSAAGCSVVADSVGSLFVAPLHSAVGGRLSSLVAALIHSAVWGSMSNLVAVLLHSAVGGTVDSPVAVPVHSVEVSSMNNLVDDVVVFSEFAADTKPTQCTRRLS